MRKIACYCCVIVLSMACLIGAAFLTGCESASGTDGLTLDPSSATLTPTSNTVTFTAILNVTNKLSLPITWSLSDSSKGSIIASSASSAVYKGNGSTGNNAIIGRDQYGNEGVAAITQTSELYALTVTASATVLTAGTNACTVSVTGGVGPYDWSVGDSSLGTVSGSGSSVMYQSIRAGSNVVTVRDDNGVAASIAIIRTGSSGSSGGPTPTPGG